MRSRTSNFRVRLSTHPIDSPLIARPNVLLALNEPALRKFVHTVEPGGWVFYNANTLSEDCRRDDVKFLTVSFTEIADEMSETRVGNVVALGELMEMARIMGEEQVGAALAHTVKSARWLELDRRALVAGKQAVRQALITGVQWGRRRWRRMDQERSPGREAG